MTLLRQFNLVVSFSYFELSTSKGKMVAVLNDYN